MIRPTFCCKCGYKFIGAFGVAPFGVRYCVSGACGAPQELAYKPHIDCTCPRCLYTWHERTFDDPARGATQ